MTNFFDGYVQGERNNYQGNIGFRFTAVQDFEIHRLGRGSRGTLNETTVVTIWEVSTENSIGSVSVGPSSTLDGDYHYEDLENPIAITAGKEYSITQLCSNGMTPWNDATLTNNQVPWLSDYADVGVGVYTNSAAYPSSESQVGRWTSVVTFYIAIPGTAIS